MFSSLVLHYYDGRGRRGRDYLADARSFAADERADKVNHKLRIKVSVYAGNWVAFLYLISHFWYRA